MAAQSNKPRMTNRSRPYSQGLAPWAMLAGCVLAGVALAGVLAANGNQAASTAASALNTVAAWSACLGIAAHVVAVTLIPRPHSAILPAAILAAASALSVGLTGGLASPALSALLWTPLALLMLGGPFWGGMAVWVASVGGAAFLGAVLGPVPGAKPSAWFDVLAFGFAALLALGALTAGNKHALSAAGQTAAEPDSDARDLREQLAEARALSEGRARFMAEMSHEIRTPLNAILGFADAMRSAVFGPLPERYGEYAGHIHDSGRQLLDLVSDLLDLSKIDAGRYALKLETVDLTAASQEAVRQSGALALTAGVQLRAMAGAPVLVEADARAVRQMLANLLSNAIKFTPRGGRVSVRAIALGESGGVEVADTGVGMTEQQLLRVAQPYAQADNQPAGARGTGLGLALVKRLCELHDGRLELESAAGQGSTARIVLPGAGRETVSARA